MAHESKSLLMPVIVTFVVIVLVTSGDRWTSPATVVDGVRVLAVEPVPAKSNWYFMSAVIQSLTEAGHVVTAYTPFQNGNRENYTEVDIMPPGVQALTDLDVIDVISNYSDPFSLLHELIEGDRIYCDMVYSHPLLDELMRNATTTGGTKEFDVIIMDSYGYSCMSYLPYKLGLPIIYVIASPMITQAERDITGHLTNPAIVPHMLNGRAILNTFYHRFCNTMMFMHSIFVTGYHAKIARLTDPKFYDSSPIVSASLIFQNSHYATEKSSPVVPNLIYVGGIHIKPTKAIPKVSENI